MRTLVLFLGALGATTIAAGCQLIGGFDAFQGSGGSAPAISTTTTTSSATTGTAATGSSSSGSSGCGDAKAPPAGMVAAQVPGGTCFWIDVKEVTAADYSAFAMTAKLTDQDPICMGNSSLAAGCGDAGPPTEGDENPVVCVDWCDANTYCTSLNKRLCGVQNAGGDPMSSEWFAACSNGGTTVYPYAGGYNGQTCNGVENTSTGCTTGPCLTDVETFQSCVTANGIFDMSGNAAEWTSECTTAAVGGQCNVHGGGANSGAEDLKCVSAKPLPRLTKNPFIGFRCCNDM